jgi:hypothetical protein
MEAPVLQASIAPEGSARGLQQRRTFALDVLEFAAGLPDELEQLFFRSPGRVVTERDFFRADIAGIESELIKLGESVAQTFFLFRVEGLGQFDLRRDVFFRPGELLRIVGHT